MDYINDKRNLMNKFKKGAIVKHSNVEGVRFVIECFDYKGLLVGLRRIYTNGNISQKILWTDPEYVVSDTLDEVNNYCMHDIETIKTICNTVDFSRMSIKNNLRTDIKKVIFNNPATIVFWSDGSKTVVKAHNDDYDPEKGLAMAIAKKALGNEGNYYNVFKKWLPNEDSSEEIRDRTCYEIAGERFNEILDKITKEAFRGF